MTFTQISDRKIVEELEQNTTPIENIAQYNRGFDSYYFKINLWYNEHGLTTSSPQKHFVEKLSLLLGAKPNYFKKYEYRTAVWGFEWENEKFVLHRSERGLSILILPKFRKDKLKRFLEEVVKVLQVENVKTPM